MKHTNPQLSAENDSWLTPAWVIEASRASLGGGIDLDPCGNAWSNEVVGASFILDGTADQNGLTMVWNLLHDPAGALRVFVNPPGGSVNDPRTKSGTVQWWLRACEFPQNRSIFLAFAAGSFLQALQKARAPYLWPLDFPHVFLRDRIDFELSLEQAAIKVRALETEGKLDQAQALYKKIAAAVKAGGISRVTVGQPTHGNLIVGLGCDPMCFHDAWSRYGVVRGV